MTQASFLLNSLVYPLLKMAHKVKRYTSHGSVEFIAGGAGAGGAAVNKQ